VTRRVALVLAVLLAAACGGDDEPERPPAVVVRVFAGTPLQVAFGDIGTAFTDVHRDVRVDFTYAAPSALLDEVERGRAAAVLATADTAIMDEAEERGWVRQRFEFARDDDAGLVFEITVLTTAVAPTEARQWVDFVRGVEGRRILAAHGFTVP
jgi:ABC-type molybdate transport system substrate-binding protein